MSAGNATVPMIPTPEMLSAEYWHLFGPAVTMYLFAIALWGGYFVQCLTYIGRGEEQELKSKALVALVFVLEAVFVSAFFYELIALVLLNFGQIAVSVVVKWNYPGQIVAAALISTGVQLFYIHRIWTFSKHNWMTVVVPLMLIPVRLGGGFAAAGYMIRAGNLLAYGASHDAEISGGLSLTANAVLDIIIAITLAFLLERERTRTNFSSSARVLRLLSKYSLSTGAITAVFNLLSAILFASNSGKNTIYGGFYAIAGVLYGNSFMFVINTRQSQSHRSKVGGRVTLDDPSGASRLRTGPQHSNSITAASGHELQEIQIFKNVERQEYADMHTQSIA